MIQKFKDLIKYLFLTLAIMLFIPTMGYILCNILYITTAWICYTILGLAYLIALLVEVKITYKRDYAYVWGIINVICIIVYMVLKNVNIVFRDTQMFFAILLIPIYIMEQYFWILMPLNLISFFILVVLKYNKRKRSQNEKLEI